MVADIKCMTYMLCQRYYTRDLGELKAHIILF